MDERNTLVKRIVLWALVLGCMVLIYSFSAQNSEASDVLSGGLLDYVVKLLRLDLTFEETELLHLIIRKTAHFTIYGLLGFLVCLLMKIGYGLKGWLTLFVPPCFSALYAATDEVHQLFVSGRSGQLSDVVLDFFGAAAGAVLAALLCRIFERRQKNG